MTGHDIPGWFIPDGEHEIGSVVDEQTLAERARKNNHRLLAIHDYNRSPDGELSCTRCNVSGRPLEDINCPATGLEHTYVSIDYE